ncbi:MAG: hypothetical protein DCF23_07655 [Cyanobium sp.]|nr:MAG: hypothetical protein DCF23_07655 [Cyanobium sp.]
MKPMHSADPAAASDQRVPRYLWLVSLALFIVFFLSATWRHFTLSSSAFDLGIFDQAIYLISRGEPPISSYLGFHILGDHASFIFYPLSLLYRLFPSVVWLFAVQALSLAAGGPIVYLIAKDYQLGNADAKLMAWIYFMYPVVINASVSDFHPEIIAIPFILMAIYAQRRGSLWLVLCSVGVILACKQALALTCIGLGVYFLAKRDYRIGIPVTVMSAAYFAFIVMVFTPMLGGGVAKHDWVGRFFSYLGNTRSEVIHTILFNPWVLIRHLLSIENAFYLFLLVVPILLTSHIKALPELIGATPALLLNLFSDHPNHKGLMLHYSLAIVPFIILFAISSRTYGFPRIRANRLILWALVCVLALTKYIRIMTDHAPFERVAEAQQVLQMIPPDAATLAPINLAPHLSHRKVIGKRIHSEGEVFMSTNFMRHYEYILINGRSRKDRILRERLGEDQLFERIYSSSEFLLFRTVKPLPWSPSLMKSVDVFS